MLVPNHCFILMGMFLIQHSGTVGFRETGLSVGDEIVIPLVVCKRVDCFARHDWAKAIERAFVYQQAKSTHGVG
jgi:hypothetical protein